MSDDRYVHEDTAFVFVAKDGRVLDRLEPGADRKVASNFFDAFRLLAALAREDRRSVDRIMRSSQAVPLFNGVMCIALTLAKQTLGDQVAERLEELASQQVDTDVQRPSRTLRNLGEEADPA